MTEDNPLRDDAIEVPSLKDQNRQRLEAFAKSGTPIQLNGLEQHLLMYFIRHTLGEEALAECLQAWEEQVSTILDGVDEQIRYAKLLAPGQAPPNGAQR